MFPSPSGIKNRSGSFTFGERLKLLRCCVTLCANRRPGEHALQPWRQTALRNLLFGESRASGHILISPHSVVCLLFDIRFPPLFRSALRYQRPHWTRDHFTTDVGAVLEFYPSKRNHRKVRRWLTLSIRYGSQL